MKLSGSNKHLFQIHTRLCTFNANLIDSLGGKPKKFKPTSEAVEDIEQLRNKLAQASTLIYPNSSSPLDLMGDALDKAVGGSPNQLVKTPGN